MELSQIPFKYDFVKQENISLSISTFAFGYNVDSKLMEEIAEIGNGIYGYCPECTMVGTIFTSYMANILTTVESTVRIDVKNKYLQKKFEIGGLYSDIPRHLGFFMNKSDFKNSKTYIIFRPGRN